MTKNAQPNKQCCCHQHHSQIHSNSSFKVEGFEECSWVTYSNKKEWRQKCCQKFIGQLSFECNLHFNSYYYYLPQIQQWKELQCATLPWSMSSSSYQINCQSLIVYWVNSKGDNILRSEGIRRVVSLSKSVRTICT